MAQASHRATRLPALRNAAKGALSSAALCAAYLIQAFAAGGEAIAFPDGYRQWTHVKSGLIDDPAHPAYPRFGGLHHIYANDIAMRGYRGAAFEDGSVLVFDLHQLSKQPDGSIDQGSRRHVDVMVKDALRFAETGGWGYQEFLAGEPSVPALTPRAQAACSGCHAARGAPDHVISDFRE